MTESIKFGDVFKHHEQEYVFLAKTGDILYAAQILDVEKTRQIKRLDDHRARRPDANRFENILYCYVMLSTEEFKDRMAHFGDPTLDGIVIDKTGVALNTEDMRTLKNDLCDPRTLVAGELKQLVRDLVIPQNHTA